MKADASKVKTEGINKMKVTQEMKVKSNLHKSKAIQAERQITLHWLMMMTNNHQNAMQKEDQTPLVV